MATWVELVTTLLTVAGMIYMVLALVGTYDFERHRLEVAEALAVGPIFAPDVSILKPVKGIDPRMYAGFVSHATQEYAGRFEILFGVNSFEDLAVGQIERVREEFPNVTIRLLECSERLGTSGKVSNLVQLLRRAHYDHILINDSDICVQPKYLERVMASFADPRVGMVTAPYLGRTPPTLPGMTLWSRLEALGISTDFLPGVLTARKLESGLRFGLGSTLAVSREALANAGGLEPLVDSLADDYEVGARIAAAGYRVELCGEVVETTVPAYTFRGFWDHQLRWARSTRDSRRLGYLGLGITYCLPWAVLNCVASGFAMWSFTLLSFAAFVRVAVALSAGVGILRDGQVLRDIWLLPLRDAFGLWFWAWSFASDEVVWREDKFRLKGGKLYPA